MISPLNNAWAGRFGVAHSRIAVHHPRHFARQRSLRIALFRLARTGRFEFRDAVADRER